MQKIGYAIFYSKCDIVMSELEDKYISLLTDFGFKRIFGTDLNKDLLIGFLNALFEGLHVITDVKYLNTEHLGDIHTERKAIFDVYCETRNGEKFIVEMQNAFQKFFKDRSLFYSTFPIREQGSKGSDWDFHLNHVYTIALLNFDMHDPAFDRDQLSHTVKLCDTYTHKVFYDKLDFIYVEIAKFDKTIEELGTTFEKWLYVLKNLSRRGLSWNALLNADPLVDPKKASTTFCTGMDSLLVAWLHASVNHRQNSSDCLPKCM